MPLLDIGLHLSDTVCWNDYLFTRCCVQCKFTWQMWIIWQIFGAGYQAHESKVPVTKKVITVKPQDGPNQALDQGTEMQWNNIFTVQWRGIKCQKSNNGKMRHKSRTISRQRMFSASLSDVKMLGKVQWSWKMKAIYWKHTKRPCHKRNYFLKRYKFFLKIFKYLRNRVMFSCKKC